MGDFAKFAKELESVNIKDDVEEEVVEEEKSEGGVMDKLSILVQGPTSGGGKRSG